MNSLSGNLYRLLRRRWYVVVVVLLLGMLGARLLDKREVISSGILHVASVEDAAKTLDLKDIPDVPAKAVALQAPETFKRSPDFKGLTATFSWDDAARSLTITISGTSNDKVVVGATEVSKRLEQLILQPTDSSLKLAVKDQRDQAGQLNDAAASIDDTMNDIPANDPTRSVLLSRAATLRSDAATAVNQGASLEALRNFLPSLVTSEPPTVTESSPGPTTYAAGFLVAAVLTVLAGSAWVLADRRIRRRTQIEQAAPGVRLLGIVSSRGGTRQIDSALIASTRAFVRDNGVRSLIVFGVPAFDSTVGDLAAVLHESLDMSVTTSEGAPAESVRADLVDSIGYIAVLFWGKTTEDQLSSAVADVAPAAGPAVATVLVNVPDADRPWVGASHTDQNVPSSQAI